MKNIELKEFKRLEEEAKCENNKLKDELKKSKVNFIIYTLLVKNKKSSFVKGEN